MTQRKISKMTHFENYAEFKPLYISMVAGTMYWKVKTFDGNTGNQCGCEYTLDEDDLEDMTAVADGYFTETYKCSKKYPV